MKKILNKKNSIILAVSVVAVIIAIIAATSFSSALSLDDR